MIPPETSKLINVSPRALPFRAPKVRRLVKRAVTPRKRNEDETIQLTATKARKKKKRRNPFVKKMRNKCKASMRVLELQNSESLIQRESQKESKKWFIILSMWIVFLFTVLLILGPIIKRTMPVTPLAAADPGVPLNTTVLKTSHTSTSYAPSHSPVAPPVPTLSVWQRNYVKFHDVVTSHYKLHGKPPADSKMLIYLATESSDPLDFSVQSKAIVSLFSFCVARQIAFYIDWTLSQEVFDFPYLSLYMNSTNLTLPHQILTWEDPVDGSAESKFDDTLFEEITIIRTETFLLYEFLSDKYPDIHEALESKGLRDENAFHILHSFLFSPVESIFAAIQPLLSTIIDSPSIFLQISTKEKESQSDFFECAKDIQETFVGVPVWVLMTEEASIRYGATAAYRKFADIVTFDESSLFNSDDPIERIKWIVAEQHLGSFCDYFIVSDSLGSDVVLQSSTPRQAEHTFSKELHSGKDWDCSVATADDEIS